MALVNTSMIAPASISIDWIGGNIYWADGGTKRIEVSKLDGSSRRVLFSKNLISPSAIVVDLQSQYVLHLYIYSDIPMISRSLPLNWLQTQEFFAQILILQPWRKLLELPLPRLWRKIGELRPDISLRLQDKIWAPRAEATHELAYQIVSP